jgi:hypothetical protein
MSIFSAFNRLNSRINNAFSSVRQTTQTINGFTANINRLSSQFNSFRRGNNGITRAIGEVSDTILNVRNTIGVVDNLISGGRGNLRNVGSAVRMAGNAVQGVGFNAAPQSRAISKAVISNNISSGSAQDWRVSISVPEPLMQGNILLPLASTGNRMIFPFNPTIILGHSANYQSIQPTHTNYPFYAYENSQVDNITITGEFYQENEFDAQYWLASLHFLRAATKMFYGSSDENLGNPPVVCRLNGYGRHVLNNIPVVITNFTTDLPADVDYIECTINGERNFVPTQCIFTVTCSPTYARRSTSRFSLQDYVTGAHVGGPEGFV